MKCIRIFGYVLLALLFISTVPYAAEAGNVKIYPKQFKPVDPSNPYNYQTPGNLLGDGGEAMYYAVVNLPAGKTVTRLVGFRSSPSTTGSTEFYLNRSRFGVADQPVQIMAHISATGFTGAGADAYDDTTISYPRVKSHFSYYVLVEIEDNNRVTGVKVVYE